MQFKLLSSRNMIWIILALSSISYSAICRWPEQSDCEVGALIRFGSDAPTSMIQYLGVCRAVWKRDITAEQVTTTAGYCPRSGTSTNTTALQVTFSVPYAERDTINLQVEQTNEDWVFNFSNFRYGFGLIILTFVLALPASVVMKIFRGTGI